MKRIFGFFLAAILICTLLPGCGNSEFKDFKFELNESKQSYSLMEYKGNNNHVEIPSEYKGKPVTGIHGAFYGNTELESVVIPDSVRVIGKSTFTDCKNLESMEIPDSVVEIRDYAFSGCKSLTELVIPQGAEIGWYAFSGCVGLEVVELGTEGADDSKFAINRGAFEGCENLEVAKIGPAYAEVGWNAFCDCERLMILYVPGNLEKFGMNSLYQCPNLTDIYFNGTWDQWSRVEIDEFWGGDQAVVHVWEE